MALKVSKKVSPVVSLNDEEKFLKLMSEVTNLDKQIFELQQRKEQVQIEMLEIKIKPFKIGQTVLAEIPSGRTRKWQKCIIENERGTMYLRPIKADGSQSERHFSMIPAPSKTYADYLKEVK